LTFDITSEITIYRCYSAYHSKY